LGHYTRQSSPAGSPPGQNNSWFAFKDRAIKPDGLPPYNRNLLRELYFFDERAFVFVRRGSRAANRF
jgi:hypothetical protein